MSRYFRRAWHESRGDEHDDWGHSLWFFEVGEDRYPVRQVEQYEHGPVLRYDGDSPGDTLGACRSRRAFGRRRPDDADLVPVEPPTPGTDFSPCRLTSELEWTLPRDLKPDATHGAPGIDKEAYGALVEKLRGEALLDQIVIHDQPIEIRAKPEHAVAMISAEGQAAGPVDRPEAVLAKGRKWLQLLDSNQRPGG